MLVIQGLAFHAALRMGKEAGTDARRRDQPLLGKDT